MSNQGENRGGAKGALTELLDGAGGNGAGGSGAEGADGKQGGPPPTPPAPKPPAPPKPRQADKPAKPEPLACPKCGGTEIPAKGGSADSQFGTVRYRICAGSSCGHKFKTRLPKDGKGNVCGPEHVCG